MEQCKFCEREFDRHTSRVYHENRCKNNPNKKDQWNKGLTCSDPRVAQYGKSGSTTKISETFRKSHSVWNKGLTINDPRVAQYGKSCSITKNDDYWKASSLERIYKKYNGKHFTQTEEYKKRWKESFFKKYGETNPQRVPEILERSLKNSFLRKEFTFPSGRIVYVQGYEGFVLEKLINFFGFDEDDIIVEKSKIPKIYYFTEDNKDHRYFPDIYIKSINKIIEVKSIYTVKSDPNIILLKHRATEKLGYKHEVWIYIKEKDEITILEDLDEYYSR